MPSYARLGPLRYQDLPYESIDNEEWPTKFAKLPATSDRHDLPGDTSVCYVELNPEGARTLIFVHGLGSYLKFWRYQLDVFAQKGYRVLAIDMIGFGKSDKPATFPYTMEAMADVVREFATVVGAQSPVIVGHSMGGQTALSFAIRYPQDLSGLVLTSPAGFEKFSAREKAWFQSVFTVALIKSASEGQIWGSIRRNNFYRWRPELRWLIEERVRTGANDDFDQYAYANVKAVHGLADNDFVRDNLDKVGVPTLIVHGDKDRLIPNPFMHGGETTPIMAYGHRGIRGSKLVTLVDCGHSVQLDCPVEYNRTVSAFLQTELD